LFSGLGTDIPSGFFQRKRNTSFPEKRNKVFRWNASVTARRARQSSARRSVACSGAQKTDAPYTLSLTDIPLQNVLDNSDRLTDNIRYEQLLVVPSFPSSYHRRSASLRFHVSASCECRSCADPGSINHRRLLS